MPQLIKSRVLDVEKVLCPLKFWGAGTGEGMDHFFDYGPFFGYGPFWEKLLQVLFGFFARF